MLELSASQKLVFFSALGGALVGFHTALLLLGHIAAWIIFNLGLGIFCIWMATLIGTGLRRKKLDNKDSKSSKRSTRASGCQCVYGPSGCSDDWASYEGLWG